MSTKLGYFCSIVMTIASVVVLFMGMFLGQAGIVFVGLLGLGFFGFGSWFIKKSEKDAAEKAAEQEKQAAIERAAFAAQGYPVCWNLPVGHFYGSYGQWQEGTPNSAGGWDMYGAVQNITQKTINYLNLYVYPKDRFGKRLANTVCWSYTGPFLPNEAKIIRSERNWYNMSVQEVAVERIVVEYADQSTQFTTNSVVITLSKGNEDSGNWVANCASADGSWGIRGTFLYKEDRTAKQVNIYAIPYDREGNKLGDSMKLFAKADYKKNQTIAVRWKGQWKGQRVYTIKLEKAELILTDDTTITIPIQ